MDGLDLERVDDVAESRAENHADLRLDGSLTAYESDRFVDGLDHGFLVLDELGARSISAVALRAATATRTYPRRSRSRIMRRPIGLIKKYGNDGSSEWSVFLR